MRAGFDKKVGREEPRGRLDVEGRTFVWISGKWVVRVDLYTFLSTWTSGWLLRIRQWTFEPWPAELNIRITYGTRVKYCFIILTRYGWGSQVGYTWNCVCWGLRSPYIRRLESCIRHGSVFDQTVLLPEWILWVFYRGKGTRNVKLYFRSVVLSTMTQRFICLHAFISDFLAEQSYELAAKPKVVS